MSGCVARKYDNGDYIKMILNSLKMSTLEKPRYLDSIADKVDKEDTKKTSRHTQSTTVRSTGVPNIYTHS